MVLFYPDLLHWLVALGAARCAFNAANDTSLELQMSAVQLQPWDSLLRASVSVYLYLWRLFFPADRWVFAKGEAMAPIWPQKSSQALKKPIFATELFSRNISSPISNLQQMRSKIHLTSQFSRPLPFHPVELPTLTFQQRSLGVLAALLTLLATLASRWWLCYVALLMPCLQLLRHGDPVAQRKR